ncbi:MAG TPA: hypothetical protein PLH18_06045, partial [Clostridia bacterium]|nr:hypothetical protein [Clostridia bacterium]
MMKKVLAFILILSLLLVILSGCGKSDTTVESQTPSPSGTVEPTSVPDINSDEIFKFDSATGTILGFNDAVSGITDI